MRLLRKILNVKLTFIYLIEEINITKKVVVKQATTSYMLRLFCKPTAEGVRLRSLISSRFFNKIFSDDAPT